MHIYIEILGAPIIKLTRPPALAPAQASCEKKGSSAVGRGGRVSELMYCIRVT